MDQQEIFTQQDILNKNLSWSFQWTHHPSIQRVIEILGDHPWRFVGGCVRDGLINKITYDIDVNTPLLPDTILDLFKDFTTSSIGRDHGTIMIFAHPFKVEITTLRQDVQTDGRKAVVQFTDNWRQDSNRRDFTINGLMMDYHQQKIYDYHGGIEDLMDGKVKFIGSLTQRVEEDYLRILRFIRFAIRFNNDFQSTLILLKPLVPGLQRVSSERIINEISLMINDNHWMKAMAALKTLSIDAIIHGQFNDDFPIPSAISIIERWSAVVLIKPNPLEKWSLDGSIKKSLMASNYDITQLEPQNLFSMFTNNLFNFSAMAIKNIIIHGKTIEPSLHALKNFLTNKQVKTSYEQQKALILSQYTGPQIRDNLIKAFYNLWKEFKETNHILMA